MEEAIALAVEDSGLRDSEERKICKKKYAKKHWPGADSSIATFSQSV